jgi:hypothetical protein
MEQNFPIQATGQFIIIRQEYQMQNSKKNPGGQEFPRRRVVGF